MYNQIKSKKEYDCVSYLYLKTNKNIIVIYTND
jgi:hypothetical protein